jgi:hypothetical protein
MATHTDHVTETPHTDHLTETEDAAFDSTMKTSASILGAIVLAVVAYWYFFA